MQQLVMLLIAAAALLAGPAVAEPGDPGAYVLVATVGDGTPWKDRTPVYVYTGTFAGTNCMLEANKQNAAARKLGEIGHGWHYDCKQVPLIVGPPPSPKKRGS